VNRLRNQLILIFLAATLAPLAATVWVTTSLLDLSLQFTSTDELKAISDSLETTGKEFYQRERANLEQRALSGELTPVIYEAADRAAWPEEVKSFAEGDRDAGFIRAGEEGDRLDYLVKQGGEVWRYSSPLGAVKLERLEDQIGQSRALIERARSHDFRHGFKLFYLLLAAAFWLVSMALLVYLAHRTSRPIDRLTAGLGRLAAGDLGARVETGRDDEIGRASEAFNNLAARLKESTDRLVYLGQMASWQTLARKMAHEVKNSLTPIRLTVEEMTARCDEPDRAFMEQASQIVVEEIETLERRIRAFSQFAAEPPVRPAEVDVNSLLRERIAFLRTAHPEVAYDCRLDERSPAVMADQDLVKGILTNLLENAADAAGEGGRILGVTSAANGRVAIEVHDSGPGLSEQARSSLFQPTISFKKKGMGLGLSIARKSALLSGGDIEVVKGELGGAGFRVLLPVSGNGD